MYNGQTITNRAVEASSHFLELGVRQFPDDWELPFMLGCNYLFELKTDDPQERKAFRRQGGEWIRHAALVGGGPPWIPLLAATILKGEGEEEAALHHLEEIYLSTRDEKTRQEVKNRLISLHSRLDFGRESREIKAFEAGWRRTAPYAPPDFFIALGERPSPRLDTAHLGADPVLALEQAEAPADR
jgi:hypothetical protein